MNIENVKANLAELQAGLVEARDKIEAKEAELKKLREAETMNRGAIQLCQHWLSVFAKEEKQGEKQNADQKSGQ